MKTVRLSGFRLSTFLGLAVLIGLQFCLPSFIEAQNLTARGQYLQAEQKYLAGDQQGALEKAKASLALDPNGWEANQIAGYASYKLGDTTSAADYCRKSLTLHPDNPTLRTFLINISPSFVAPAQADQRLQLPVPSVSDFPAASLSTDCSIAKDQALFDTRDVDSGSDTLGGFFLSGGLAWAGSMGLGLLGYELGRMGGGSNYYNSGAAGATVGVLVGWVGGAILGTQIAVGGAGAPGPEPGKFKGQPADYSCYSEEYRKEGLRRKKGGADTGGVLGGILLPIVINIIIVEAAY